MGAKRIILQAAIIGCGAMISASAGAAGAAGAEACKALTQLTDVDLAITRASFIPATDALPEHCDVVGLIPPNVGFEVKLPTQWNGKFLMSGNGGFAGVVQDAQSYGLARSYATAATDTGHEGPDPAFALSRAAEIDFGYRAVHVTQAAAKRLIKDYYGRAPRYSYFKGCSTGGRQALMEAQRFPEDFDGIIAGAPIYDFSLKQTYNAAWATLALFGDGRKGLISRDQLKTLGAAVYQKCDGLDGLEDGLIDDPRACDFRPQTDLKVCAAGAKDASCFSQAQIDAIAKVYNGPGALYNRAGKAYPGHVVGGEWLDIEGDGAEFGGGWDLYLIGKTKSGADAAGGTGLDSYLDSYGGDPFLPVQFRNAINFFKYFAFSPDRPDFDLFKNLKFEDLPAEFASEAAIDARASDLTRFEARGGKLILWHGWADIGLIPLRTIQYYEAVRETMGAKAADGFTRLFMAPGVYHCEGGPGPDLFDDLTALERWVEKGAAPEEMTAYRMPAAAARTPGYISERKGLADIAGAEMSRPLCAYPKVARYQGSGDAARAENFRCVAAGGE